MIQRIQTIYLLLALALLIACCLLPIAALMYSNGQVLPVNIFEIDQGKIKTPLLGFPIFLAGLIAVVDLIIIFLYKKRKKQMTLCIINIILLVCLNLLLFYQLIYFKKTGLMVSYHLTFVFPLLSAVFTYLAYGGIKKDENMVRSYERLR